MTIYTIYRIMNLTNHKVYIGWTSRVPEIRFKEHQDFRKPKYQSRSLISCAIEKHGVDCFAFEVLYQTLDQLHSKEMEAVFINENTSMASQHGYNLDIGGTGHKRTPETIEKHRQAISGRKQSAEHVAKRRMLGKKNAMSKQWIVTFPDGHEEVIVGLTRFAKDIGLDPSNLRNTFYGKTTNHKGYRARIDQNN